MKKTQKLAYLYTALAILFWSTVASAFKLSLRKISPFQLVFYASLTSSIVLFIILVVQGKFKHILKIKKKHLLASGSLGLINPFIYYLILFYAYDRLPAQIAQPLNCTWAVLIVILSVPLLNQKLRIKNLAAILVSFAGVVVVTSRGNLAEFVNADILGVTLALSSAILWALYWILNVKDQREQAPKLFLNYTFGTLYLFFLSFTSYFDLKISFNNLVGPLYVGFFEMGLTSFVWLKALQLSESTAKISNYIYLFPFISLIFIHYIVGETILLTSFIGLLIIVAGIFLQEKFTKAQVKVD
ncbi:MAG: DMT family transporter [Candidatus Marinimicrobia bacterium]|nr:DMT family transporter [Candidatus Neomarinimicrobiota bacterium]